MAITCCIRYVLDPFKRDEKAEDLAQAPNGVISWKTLNGEQIRAAIAATALTSVEPQAPAFK
jgi:hypothetical protein